ncbi:TPA: phage tail protein [Citrobacter farmeri]|nr:phage tail protein [Citrobacter farmeri]HBI2991744.1 phage tail protein [Citrobacter farmeri]HBI2997874.1 phage tail protein [Citrobacter farmeri]HBI3003230.1 phage tail protein [Citrobacter farmeri]
MANLPETPQWEEGIYQIEVSDPVLGGPDGISNRQGKQLASRTLYLKQQVEKGGSELAKHIAAADPHTQYAPKASPTFTGTPTAPTPANSDNSKKLATTEFVAKALAALAGSAPETLDTLKELADALGNDPNFATTVLNKLAEKLAKDQHGADIPDPALFVKNLRLGAGAPAIGIPFFWPLAAMPNTIMDEWSDMVFLKPNGASFSAATYPKLAKVWTGLIIPDMRGEFPRIWDDGRGVDAGRALLSAQLDALQNITGSFSAATAGAAQLSVLVNGEGGAFYPGSQTTSPPSAQATTGNERVNTMYFDAGRVARTSTETRSRNIALNFLIRAK